MLILFAIHMALSLIENIIAIVVYYESAALQSIAMEEHT